MPTRRRHHGELSDSSRLLATPEDREPAVRKVIEAAGGKVISFYLTTGEPNLVKGDCRSTERSWAHRRAVSLLCCVRQ
jgi:uncharacterized protein with GYD domain